VVIVVIVVAGPGTHFINTIENSEHSEISMLKTGLRGIRNTS
jgi:hypothetical protein